MVFLGGDIIQIQNFTVRSLLYCCLPYQQSFIDEKFHNIWERIKRCSSKCNNLNHLIYKIKDQSVLRITTLLFPDFSKLENRTFRHRKC